MISSRPGRAERASGGPWCATLQPLGRLRDCPCKTIPLRMLAAASGFASASSNIREPSPVKRRAIVKGVSFACTWYVGPQPAEADDPSAAAHVFGPTTPSAVRPCCACHVRVAAAVAGPNLPSGATPTTFCHSTTSGPLAPCWIVACTVTEPGAGATIGMIGTEGAADGIAVATAGTEVATAAMATP